MYNWYWSPHASLSHRVKFNPGPRPGFFLPESGAEANGRRDGTRPGFIYC